MKNRFDIFKLDLNALIRYLFVPNRGDIESASNNNVATTSW